jgi:NitT/TauT family transport system substrate-binding protein
VKYRISAVVATVALAAVLTGCAGATPAAQPSATPSAPTTITPITVAVSPSASTSVPMYLGVEKGFFKAHGLDVKLTVLTNGTVAIPQVLSGQTQFSMASLAPVLQAVKQGLAVRIIGAANIIPTTNNHFQGIVVRDSISKLSDAKVFAAQSALLDPVQAGSVDASGGKYTSMTILQVPLPSIADSLKSGSADAALLNQPFLAQAIATPGVKLLNYITTKQSLPGTAGAVFIGGTAYMKANPTVTKEFQAAVLESFAYAQSHIQAAADYVPKTGLSPTAPTLESMPEYAATPVTAAKYDELLTLFSKYGQNTANLTSKDILYTAK